MSFQDRQDKILDILQKKDTMKNSELAKLLYVSPATMRRDLDAMEQKGLIIRKYGICTLSNKARDERNFFLLREQNQSSAKQTMARKAVKLIKNGDRIMLDGSSTSVYNIVHLLEGFENLFVITNNVKISFALGTMGITNVSTGGRMIKKSFTLYGQEAIETVRSYNADVFFFSCSGVSEDGYVTEENIELDELRKEMMKRSKKKVLLCAGDKIGKRYTHNLCHISDIDEVICDVPLPDYLVKKMKQK